MDQSAPQFEQHFSCANRFFVVALYFQTCTQRMLTTQVTARRQLLSPAHQHFRRSVLVPIHDNSRLTRLILFRTWYYGCNRRFPLSCRKHICTPATAFPSKQVTALFETLIAEKASKESHKANLCYTFYFFSLTCGSAYSLLGAWMLCRKHEGQTHLLKLKF